MSTEKAIRPTLTSQLDILNDSLDGFSSLLCRLNNITNILEEISTGPQSTTEEALKDPSDLTINLPSMNSRLNMLMKTFGRNIDQLDNLIGKKDNPSKLGGCQGR